MTTNSNDTRTATIAGLRALARFLEAHPDLPVFAVDARPLLHGSDEEKRQAVDQIAAVLGSSPERRADGDHYHVQRDFGGGVNYHATAITTEHMRDWEALTSYRGAVTA